MDIHEQGPRGGWTGAINILLRQRTVLNAWCSRHVFGGRLFAMFRTKTGSLASSRSTCMRLVQLCLGWTRVWGGRDGAGGVQVSGKQVVDANKYALQVPRAANSAPAC